MIQQREFFHNEWYRYLNCGYRLPLVGGTDKMSSDVPVGMYRTYTRIPDDEEFTYENWCRNVAKGRTILSGGPIIHLSVDGFEVGDTVELSKPGTVEVTAWAESVVPMSKLEIVQEGKVVASAESDQPTRRLALNEKIKDQWQLLARRACWRAGLLRGLPVLRCLGARHLLAYIPDLCISRRSVEYV